MNIAQSNVLLARHNKIVFDIHSRAGLNRQDYWFYGDWLRDLNLEYNRRAYGDQCRPTRQGQMP